jgi:hypothetical protein
MSEYQKISDELQQEMGKNAEMQNQIKQRTEEMLAAFWNLKPRLKPVDKLELTSNSMSAWMKSHLTKQG